jgi:hypothetical protein
LRGRRVVGPRRVRRLGGRGGRLAIGRRVGRRDRLVGDDGLVRVRGRRGDFHLEGVPDGTSLQTEWPVGRGPLLFPLPIRVETLERAADDPRNVHLRAADPLGDLRLQQVLLEAQAQDLARAIVEDPRHPLDRHARLDAAAHGVAVIPDPPLARALYASVEINRMIPEELFQGVAQLLAYVYRVAGQRAAAA